MTRIRFPGISPKHLEEDKPTPSQLALSDHIQHMTDTLTQALSNGLTITDNFQQEYRNLNFESGRELLVTPQLSRLKIKGALLVDTNGTIITGFKTTRKGNNQIGITVTMDISPAILTILLLGE